MELHVLIARLIKERVALPGVYALRIRKACRFVFFKLSGSDIPRQRRPRR